MLDIDALVLRVADPQRMPHFYGEGCSAERWQDAIAAGAVARGRSLIDLVPASGAVEPRCGREGPGPSILRSGPEGNVVELKGPPNPV